MELRMIATASHYAGLLDVIRARVAELGITHETLDTIAGLPAGYASKLLCNPPKRRLGPTTMFNVLEALGLKSSFFEDPETLARVRSRLTKRRRPRVRTGAAHRRGVTIYLLPDFLRQIGSKGGAATSAKLTPQQRRESAQRAARARWSKARAIDAAPAIEPDKRDTGR